MVPVYLEKQRATHEVPSHPCQMRISRTVFFKSGQGEKNRAGNPWLQELASKNSARNEQRPSGRD